MRLFSLLIPSLLATVSGVVAEPLVERSSIHQQNEFAAKALGARGIDHGYGHGHGQICFRDASCPKVNNADPKCVNRKCSFTCKSGYFLVDKKCVQRSCKASACTNPIPSHSLRHCNAEKLCDFKCVTGYERKGDKCSKIKVCNVKDCKNLIVPNSHRICDLNKNCNWECNEGYFRKNGACQRRACNVNLCKNSIPRNAYRTCVKNQCSFLCNVGFRWNGSQCSPGISACTASKCTNPIPDKARRVCREGRCDFVCFDGYYRDGNTCRKGCPPGFTKAPNGKCVDLNNDTGNCGAFENICPEPYSGNGYAICSRGDCGIICKSPQRLRTPKRAPAYCA